MYFTGIGTVVNVLAIVLGGVLGLVLGGGIKEAHQQAVLRMLGIATLFIGLLGVCSGMLTVTPEGRLQSQGELGVIISLVLGTFLGELLDIEGKMERLGQWLRKKASRGEDNRFVEGFLTASLVVCVGAMAIVGSIQDALAHDPSTLFTKSILDCVIILVFASTYGVGAIFSALPVGVLQGSVTLCAALVAPLFSDAVTANISLVGSVLIFCVGANLALQAKFRVANMLPALVVGAVWVSIF